MSGRRAARRWWAAALVGVVCLPLLAACGVSEGDLTIPTATTVPGPAGAPEASTPSGDADPRFEADALDDVVDATLAVRSLRLHAWFALDVIRQELSLDAEGGIDDERRVADLQFQLHQAELESSLDLRADGEHLWVRPEGRGFPLEIPGGATWIQGDARRLFETPAFEPAGLLAIVLVLRAGDDAAPATPEEVDGEQLDRWRFDVAYQDAVAAAGDDALRFRRALSLSADEDPLLHVEVRVGPDRVVRDLEITIEAQGTLPLGGTYDLVIDAVGEPVPTPTAPPTADVLDAERSAPLLDELFES